MAHRLLTTATVFLVINVTTLALADEFTFFRTRIEPVLEQHCYSCHSGQAESIKGGLRLDTKSAMQRGGESGPAVVPEDVDKSLIIAALRYDGLEMPPKSPLPKEIIGDFVTWIKNGAPDPRLIAKSDEQRLAQARSHWSFMPITNPTPPKTRNSWVQNEIDRFVFRRLKSESIRPSKDADPRTLIRRLYLDLIGLPPLPAEVDAFVANPTEVAYQHVITELLESPHYGERWGRYWLDMARYADSNGYESDRPRPYAWRWRDWVINSLNANMPFDQFTIEQLAGDLLPGATLEQQVATGFHRNTLVNTEGGVDREEDRVKRTVDRTNTLGKVWLGLTLGCSQCHSHKYDPITQHEYYSMYAFFNSLAEPNIPAPTTAQVVAYKTALTRYENDHQEYLKAIRDYRSEQLRNWENTVQRSGFAKQADSPDGEELEVNADVVATWEVVNPISVTALSGSDMQLQDDLSVFVVGPNDQADTYTLVLETMQSGISAIRIEAMADERLPAHGPGLAGNGNYVLSSLRVYAKPASDTNPANKGNRVRLKNARADFSQGGRQVTSVLGDDPTDGWAIYPNVGVNHFSIFELVEDVNPETSGELTRLTIELDHQVHHDHNIGRFRVSLTSSPRPVPDGLVDAAFRDVLTRNHADRTGTDVLRLVKYFDYHEPELDDLLLAELEHREAEPKSPTVDTKAQVVTEEATRRTTQVHIRGSFLDKGDEVISATPAVLPKMPIDADGSSRLDLAKWLVSDDNPLTARVIVNRIWQQHFGRGIVVTDDDFGTQGEPPSHPELLDWLAFRFRDSGWNMKEMHRMIVSSATWRQSSFARPELSDRDPYNILLARQNRLRVEAEIVRDLALSASDLLQPKIGGPSVYPRQSEDLIKLGFQTSLSWPVSKDGDQYRRGMYTFFQRTVPYPMLIEFDAADSNASCTRRERSNTPLQALTLWNDPVFVEASQALGKRLQAASAHAGAGDTGNVNRKIALAFEICLSRSPTSRETEILRNLYIQRLGESDESGACFAVARAIMNLDEFITRE